MSKYEELRERVAKHIAGPEYKMAIRVSDAVLAEVLSALLSIDADMAVAPPDECECAITAYFAVLRASPLEPPK